MANQQYDFEAQRAAENSRQFGATQGLAGATAAGQMAQTLANIGQTQQNADAQRLGMQQSTAAQQQALNQQMRDLDYADFQKAADDPYTRLQRYMGLMSGVPQNMTSTTTTSAPGPGLAQQLAGAGLGAYSTYKMFSGG
jgi:ubiquinone biosynthesis protein UbiJ